MERVFVKTCTTVQEAIRVVEENGWSEFEIKADVAANGEPLFYSLYLLVE